MKKILFNPALVLSLILAVIVASINVTPTFAHANKVSATDILHPGSELDEDASAWGAYTDGTSTGIVENVADPSLDGR